MYYYIMETARGRASLWQERIKDYLGELGIAGETVSPTPGRTIEELTNLGIIKGYSTIVAVGSQNMVNKIISVMLKDKTPKDIVLGIIPDDFNSQLARKIGVKDLKSACETLKYRKLKTIDLCLIEPNRYIITEAVIESSKPIDSYIALDTLKAGLPFNKIILKPGLELYITDNSVNVKKSKGFLSWFIPDKSQDFSSSFFRSKRIKIETLDVTLPVKVDQEVVAKTPISCYNRSRVLKIVIARDKIDLKE